MANALIHGTAFEMDVLLQERTHLELIFSQTTLKDFFDKRVVTFLISLYSWGFSAQRSNTSQI